MNINKIKKQIPLIIFLTLCISHIANADSFSPNWQSGDKWTITAIYHSPITSDKTSTEWSAPIYWTYEIEKKNSNYILKINNQQKAPELSTQLIFQAADFSLTSAEITKIRRRQQIIKILNYDTKAPVHTKYTLTPFDMPVFPLTPSDNSFSVTRPVDKELSAKITITQSVRLVTEVPDELLKLLPYLKDNKELMEVRCMSEGKTLFLQYWDKEHPWAIYGENENMKYWLSEEK